MAEAFLNWRATGSRSPAQAAKQPSGGTSGILTILRSPIRLKNIVTVFAALEISCGSMSFNLSVKHQ